MRILGPPSVETIEKLNWPAEVNTLFRGTIAPELWSAGTYNDVDPVGLIAQSILETGGGRFTGKVKPEFYNPCGLKVRHMNLFPGITDGDNPLAHAMFPNWAVGCLAHTQHVLAYTGYKLYESETIVDPRYYLVADKNWCENWEDLSGKWAPASDYGQRIVNIARRLQGR